VIKKKVEIELSWNNLLENAFKTNSFCKLKTFLIHEKNKHTVYPPDYLIFSAFNHTPFNKVKVIIIGQDPYHGKGQANGLCFSVNDGIKIPPSLANIYKEIEADTNCKAPNSGDLKKWAKQGVFLLNSTLTVRAKNAGSHQKKGWENFTDKVIFELSNRKKKLVFLLWGKFAQKKSNLIDKTKHKIFNAPHPSPLSAYSGFFGCKHFSKTNEFLISIGKKPINW